jgi:hypothetical protein
MKGRIRLLIAAMFALVVILAIPITPVMADVPDVLTIEPWTSGSDTILNITVRHAAPSGFHYIDQVEVDIDGSVQVITIPSAQTTTTFLVQYNMGTVTTTPTVTARARCTVHGWSAWSSPVVVPELSIVLPLLLVALTAVLILFRSKRVQPSL